MNEQIKKEIVFFKKEFSKSGKRIKKSYHYNSVINLSKGILKYNNSDANDLKKGLISFFQELDVNELNKTESIFLYKTYLLPIGQYLIEKDNFRTKMSIVNFLFTGVLVDIVIHYLLFEYYIYPVFLFIFIFFGCIRKKERIKKGKFFSLNW